MNIAEADESDSVSQSDAPIFDPAFVVTQAEQLKERDLSVNKMSDQIMDQMADGATFNAAHQRHYLN